MFAFPMIVVAILVAIIVAFLLRLAVRKTTVFIMVGPPLHGKTTWRHQNLPNAKVLSRDECVQQSLPNGWNYSDAFNTPDNEEVKIEHTIYGLVEEIVTKWDNKRKKVFQKCHETQQKANELLAQKKEDAVRLHNSWFRLTNLQIVMDSMNHTSKTRKQHIDWIRTSLPNSRIIAVELINELTIEDFDSLNCQRRARTGQYIPLEILKHTMSKRDFVDEHEDFDEHRKIDNNSELKLAVQKAKLA